jgi:hypothetical protein
LCASSRIPRGSTSNEQAGHAFTNVRKGTRVRSRYSPEDANDDEEELDDDELEDEEDADQANRIGG